MRANVRRLARHMLQEVLLGECSVRVVQRLPIDCGKGSWKSRGLRLHPHDCPAFPLVLSLMNLKMLRTMSWLRDVEYPHFRVDIADVCCTCSHPDRDAGMSQTLLSCG